MKWVKVAIGAVIALSVIPLVVVTVNNLDTPKLKTIEFEVIDLNIDDNFVTFSENTRNNIHSLAISEEGKVINLITVTVNDVELETVVMYYYSPSGGYSFEVGETLYWTDLTDSNTNTADLPGYTLTVGEIWTMTFEVSNPLPPLVKLLVGLVPLIFVAGVVSYLFVKTKTKEE